MQVSDIFFKRIGYSNVILVANGSNSVIIDTGVSGNIKTLEIWLRQHHLQANDIKLIILTHVHYDHTGNLNELKKLTGAKVLVHRNEFENLKNGFIEIPAANGIYPRVISAFGRMFFPRFVAPKPLNAELINENIFELAGYGVEGKVISTPGHTAGSQSVIIGDSLIAGDTFIHLPNGRIFPPFVNNPEQLLETWENIMELGVKRIYPGHGKPIRIEKVMKELQKLKEKKTAKVYLLQSVLFCSTALIAEVYYFFFPTITTFVAG